MRSRAPDTLFRQFCDQRDPQALAALFDLVAPQLLAVARHLVRTEADAEDVVQATFLAALEGADRFHANRPVVPWLMGILSRQAGTLRRARRLPDSAPWEPASATEPLLAAEHAELRGAVDQAMRNIAAPYGEVLSLHLAEGKDPDEIASRLGRKTATVRVQLHRGLKQLRRRLPASLAGGSVASIAPRGLDAVKAVVLQHPIPAAALPPGVATTSILGSLIMNKLMWTGAALAVLATASWIAVTQPEPPNLSERGAKGVSLHSTAPPAKTIADAAPTAPLPHRAQEGSLSDGLALVSDGESTASDSPHSPEQSSSYSVTGEVLDKKTGEPIGDAEVFAYFLSQDGTETSLYERGHADKRGKFRVQQLPSFPFSVALQSPRHAMLSVQPKKNGDDFSIDLGRLFLERGVAIQGRVIQARTGRPLAGAAIFEYLVPGPGTKESRRAHAWLTATTNEAGQFLLGTRRRFTGKMTQNLGFLAATTEGLGWVEVALLEGGGSEREIEILVGPQSALKVSVIDESNLPIAGASIRLSPQFRPFDQLQGWDAEFWGGPEGPVHSLFLQTTNESGQALFSVLPLPQDNDPRAPATYELTATSSLGLELGRTRVHLASNRLNHVVLGPDQRDEIRIFGTVRDSQGHPIGEAQVRGAEQESKTSLRGHYQLTLARPDQQNIRFEVSAQDYATNSFEIALEEDDEIEREFVLHRALPIKGRVVDPQGAPVARATVSCRRPYGHPAATGHSTSSPTDQEGSFTLPMTSTGEWQLTVSPPFGEPGWGQMEIVRAQGGDQEITITLPRNEVGGAHLLATIHHAESGAPLDANHVYLCRRAPYEPQRFVGHPSHRIAGAVVAEQVPPGQWRIWAVAEGLAPGYADVDVTPQSREIQTSIALGDFASLEAHLDVLQTSSGPPPVTLSFEHLHAVPGFGPWHGDIPRYFRGELDENGSVRFEGLLPGSYRLTVATLEEMFDEHITLEPSRTTSVELHTKPFQWVTLRGNDSLPSGTLLAKLRNEEQDWSSPWHHCMREEGEFHTGFRAPLGSTEWELSFHSAEASPRERPLHQQGWVTVTPAEAVEIWASW